MQGRTLYQMFLESVKAYPNRNAVGFRKSRSGEYVHWTYSELAEKVRSFRRGLAALGLKKGDRIAITSQENRVEWAITDLAAQSLGLITVPIYGTLPAVQGAFYLRDSGARALVLSDQKQRAKLAEIRPSAPDLECIIAMEGSPADLAGQNILAFNEVFSLGDKATVTEAELDAISNSLDPNDVATLIYTSGTTGDPKGAMLTHTNLLNTPDEIIEDRTLNVGPDDVFLSFLPLSHITERVGGHYLPLRLGAEIIYSQGLSAVGHELTKTVRPTVMLCVPRLFENMHEKALEAIEKSSNNLRRAALWAIRVGSERAKRRSEGRPVGPLLALQYALAEKTLLPRLREKVTGGRLKYFVSGGAPLDPQTGMFFLGIGVHLLEGYGLSETSIIALNRPGNERIGNVGQLIPDVEISFATDGEILMRGPGRMAGYWNDPQSTEAAIDADGWFHTGDIGAMADDGVVRITDRKKDIIVLTNGKKVAPQPIEAMLKHSALIQESVLMGDKQSTIMAILFPATDKLTAWALENNIEFKSVQELLDRPEVQKLYRSELDRCTTNLADFEKIRRFKLAPAEATIAGGELTPTLKVKRRFVVQKYGELIAAIAR